MARFKIEHHIVEWNVIENRMTLRLLVWDDHSCTDIFEFDASKAAINYYGRVLDDRIGTEKFEFTHANHIDFGKTQKPSTKLKKLVQGLWNWANK